jgi:hypothetical protein
VSAALLRRLARLEKLANPDPRFADASALVSDSDEITDAAPFFRMLGLPNIADCLERAAELRRTLETK